MKNISKKVSVLLMIIMMVNLFTFNVNAQDSSKSKKLFKEASDETIVCYYLGMPIRKDQVDENNVIKQSVIDSIENNNIFSNSINDSLLANKTVSKSTRTEHTVTIPSKYSEATVVTVSSAPRYSQTDYAMYLTKKSGIKFANGITSSNIKVLAACAAGFTPVVGPTITVAFTVSELRNAEIASKIRSYTDNNSKVRINKAVTPYGKFYAVSGWSGRKFKYVTYNDGSNSVKLTGILYK